MQAPKNGAVKGRRPFYAADLSNPQRFPSFSSSQHLGRFGLAQPFDRPKYQRLLQVSRQGRDGARHAVEFLPIAGCVVDRHLFVDDALDLFVVRQRERQKPAHGTLTRPIAAFVDGDGR